jgi:hypothetical protein
MRPIRTKARLIFGCVLLLLAAAAAGLWVRSFIRSDWVLRVRDDGRDIDQIGAATMRGTFGVYAGRWSSLHGRSAGYGTNDPPVQCPTRERTDDVSAHRSRAALARIRMLVGAIDADEVGIALLVLPDHAAGLVRRIDAGRGRLCAVAKAAASTPGGARRTLHAVRLRSSRLARALPRMRRYSHTAGGSNALRI